VVDGGDAGDLSQAKAAEVLPKTSSISAR